MNQLNTSSSSDIKVNIKQLKNIIIKPKSDKKLKLYNHNKDDHIDNKHLSSRNKRYFSFSSFELQCELTNTLDSPTPKLLLKSVATMIYLHIEQDVSSNKILDKKSQEYFFSEEKYMLEFPENFDQKRKNLLKQTPSVEDIIEFIGNLYDVIECSCECLVILLIYINRFKKETNILILPLTWRPLVLVSIFIAQKVWDDHSITNKSLVNVYPFFSNSSFNLLEHIFLGRINFNTNIKFSQYTMYFLELKSFVIGDEDGSENTQCWECEHDRQELNKLREFKIKAIKENNYKKVNHKNNPRNKDYQDKDKKVKNINQDDQEWRILISSDKDKVDLESRKENQNNSNISVKEK